MSLASGSEDEDWVSYCSLQLDTKLQVFISFLEESRNLLKNSIKGFETSAELVNKIKQPGEIRPSNLLELSLGMLRFISKYDKSKESKHPTTNTNTNPKADAEEVLGIVEHFWFTLDTLYDAASSLLSIVSETREIIQTCYVYTTNFYNWELENLDSFAPDLKIDDERRKKVDRFMAKVLGKQKFVEVARFLSLTDFKSSPYQTLVQDDPIITQGMSLKLKLE